MESEDDLDILTALLTESEGAGEDRDPACQETEDDLNDLFDNDENESEYKDGIEEDVKGGDRATDPFGDVDDIEDETVEAEGEATGSLDKSREDLEEEMRRMQEKMQKLQQQLAASQKASTPARAASQKASTPGRSTGSLSSPKPRSQQQLAASQKASTPGRSTGSLSSPKPRSPPTPQGASRQIFTTKPPPSTQKTKTQTVKPSTTPERREGQRLNDSSDFSAQLINADSFKRKPRVAHQTSSSPEDRSPLVEIKIGSTFLPVETTSDPLRSPPAPKRQQAKPPSHPPAPKDVAVEKYSGLRLRRPRVSSTEMDNKMANRRMIRLSQLPERLAKEKLEDSDWVTFAVLVSKATPQSNSSGKTFSIWKLNDLHNLDVYVSLLLFGEVHKEHWKTEPGTVIGVLNPNQMKQKDGYDGVSLSVDHPQKVLLMGEAQDYGTCKAAKKNGEPCSQIVNLYECQYCQYHVKAAYKKMSSKRAELQSSFSGKATGKVKAKGGSLKERLCNEGFYYGGVSSSACATALSKPNKGTLDKLFVKGAQPANKAKTLALKSGEVSGCTDDFKTLMAVQTPGALQLKKHLIQAKPSGSKDTGGEAVQSITASELIKQQKQKQQELLENRRRRAEEIQMRVSQNTPGAGTGATGATGPSSLPGRGALLSPRAASEVPKASPTVPRAPTLGRGFSEGEDILFFDHSPPPAPSSPSLSAAKLAALKKLRAKGASLAREDPNSVKRKRSDGSDISARVEKNLLSPDGESSEAEGDMPAQKKRREQLEYVESEEFQKILNAKSRHGLVLKAAEYQLQERYFDVLVQKEQMEDKMRDTREMKCRAVSCKKCKYTYFKPADRCVEQNHDLHWHDATKRFFKCPCGQRAIALDRLPHKHCSNCGLFKWERDGMLKEKKGPKLGGELLQPRGEEHGQFLNSMN